MPAASMGGASRPASEALEASPVTSPPFVASEPPTAASPGPAEEEEEDEQPRVSVTSAAVQARDFIEGLATIAMRPKSSTRVSYDVGPPARGDCRPSWLRASSGCLRASDGCPYRCSDSLRFFVGRVRLSGPEEA